jgi:hypothetical protein
VSNQNLEIVQLELFQTLDEAIAASGGPGS